MNKKFYTILAVIVALFNIFAMAIFIKARSERILVLITELILVGVFLIAYKMTTKSTARQVNWLQDRLDSWSNISVHVNTAGDEALNKLPVGIILYDDDYTVKWANPFARSIYDNKLLEINMEVLDRVLHDNLVRGIHKFTHKIYNNIYDITKSNDANIIYLFDETSRENIVKRYSDKRIAIGYIAFDNIDTGLSRLDVSETSELRSRYLSELVDYLNIYDGYLKSYASDRYLFIVDYKNLIEMIAAKFPILDGIRNISTEEENTVTISVGIACWDVSYNELGELAQAALQTAEKRGGDQVVVNVEGKKVEYFGGKTTNKQRKTKVQVRVTATSLSKLIVDSKNVVVTGHEYADLDAFGAMIGMLKFAEAFDREAKIVIDPNKLDGSVKKALDRIRIDDVTLYGKIILDKIPKNYIVDSTLLIVVDLHNPDMVMRKDITTTIKDIVVIDHHRKGEKEFENPKLSYIEPSASSTVEIVSELFGFIDKKIELTPYEATIMLGGLIVDTNNFTYRTGSRTFEAASILKDYGADMIKVRSLLRDGLSRHKAINQLFGDVEILHTHFAVTRADSKSVLDRTLLAQVSDALLEIDDIDAAFTIGRVTEDEVGISARSLDMINVQVLMEELGGGGHYNNAAVQFKGKTVDQVFELLLPILEKNSREGENVKVILLEDVKGKGSKNDVIEVPRGFANHLIKDGHAVDATPANLKRLKEEEEKRNQNEQDRLEVINMLKKEIETKVLTMYLKIGENGKVFGSINSKAIVDAFFEAYEIKLDKKKIKLQSEINSLGIYNVDVALHPDVTASFEIHVLEA